MTWRRVDLHIHTLASQMCYQQPNTTYLKILQKAEEKGLDIIALTDHNTVAGIDAIRSRIEELELLERLKRLRDDERRELEDYRRLGRKMLILPGFEFTATLGFHILGIFPPETPVRELEHLLLNLRIPADRLDQGSSEVGATVDVITAYRTIAEAGGLVIAAHADSTHGVAMRGFDFGGQTKIAYTQDPNLHALEVTDLMESGRRTTASFYDGSKPEYPRRMHCIQGSDAHRLDRDPRDKHSLGIGDRVTEIDLPEVSFEALKAVFLGKDFTRTRPYQPALAVDYVRAAQERGPTIVQSFHDGFSRQGGRLQAILRDVVAFANTNGGTLYVGASAKKGSQVSGVDRPDEASRVVADAVGRAVAPPLDVDIDQLKSQGKTVLRVTVPKGDNPPYALDGVEVYIRQEAETSRAMRDEIVQLVRKSIVGAPSAQAAPAAQAAAAPATVAKPPAVAAAPADEHLIPPPRTGVEIVEVTEREGTKYYTVRDLRNRNVVQNVTRMSARRLWRYAITENESAPVQEDKVTWRGSIGLVKAYRRAGRKFYDMAQRGSDGHLHLYYGVTDDGIHGDWKQFVAQPQ
ncbi:MAG: Divergent AAA domain protein [Chloroflexi bacterium ADurb.Bin180]|nr:MAG: Divergent AAA domain protein [Chloroflexi bacterium ADurb.Bin180]HNR96280.1 putative DNA binding domain-containing protein [Anaerolineae bacterium]HOU23823.1 putative DNA binding domain-containing protein [Anaerolineae bacterium]